MSLSLLPTRLDFRRRLAQVAAVLLGLALFGAPAFAQSAPHNGHSAAEHVEGSTFVLKAGPDGNLVCESATETEVAALSRAAASPNFTVFTSTNEERDITGMRILLRGTDQILEFPAALLAFRRAAARWERAISTPITTVIDVDFGLNRFSGGPFPENVLASATTAERTFAGIGPAQIVDALLAQNGSDPQLAALYNGIPLPTPSTAGPALQTAVVARPIAQAFGYLPAEADPDPVANPFGEFPTIGFNAAFTWDFDPTDGVTTGQFDFEAVAVHEMGHSLGFRSIIGQGGPPQNRFAVFDLFRVRPDAVTPGEPLDDGLGWEVAPRVVTPGPPSPDVVQVFFDGNQELPLSTATGGRQGGDGEQASHWRNNSLGTPYIGIMDPDFASGTVGDYNDNDLRAFQTMGYQVTFDVPLVTADVTVNGVPYDVQLPDSLVYLDLGDAAPGGSVDLEVGLTNTSTGETLDYSAEVEVAVSFPADALQSLVLSSTGGDVAPGASETITLSAGASQPGVFYGTLRVETNIDGVLLFEVPFTYSVGGATPPLLALSSETIGDLGDFDDDAGESRPLITLTNDGGLVLDYEVNISLETDGNPFPFDPSNGFSGSGDPIFVTPSSGSLDADASQEITVTVEGGLLAQGFYRGEVEIVTNSLEFSAAGVPRGFTDSEGNRVIQVVETLPFTLTVGDPLPPILAVTDDPAPVSVPADRTAPTELTVENTGQAPLTFVRVLEPALSSFTIPIPRSADALAGADAAPTDLSDFLRATNAARGTKSAARGAVGDSLFAIVLPDASSTAAAIALIPDGPLLVADANDGPTYVIRSDLSAIDAVLDGFVDSGASGQVLGLTYDDKNETLWYATSGGEVFEATFGATIEPTGRSFTVDFSAGSIAYSPELDAFFIAQRQSTLVYAVDSDGEVLPGYPVETPSRGGVVPGITVTDGVLEVLTDNRLYTQVDQFGRLFAESEEVEVPLTRLGGSQRINGFLRSTRDPDGVFYYLTRPGGGEVRVVGVDPTDLPVYTRAIVEAGEPLYGVGFDPGDSEAFDLVVSPRGLEPGSYTESVAFLTNNPDIRIALTTVDIIVEMGTPAEAGATLPTAFAVHQNYPNPFAARTTVRFDLPSAARATVTVFNVLGQRVAVLLDDETLEAGAHTVDFDARSLASGTYLLRVEADAFVGARRITVVN
ncbi:MAG: NF038122 family metalloprotease [Rhodothermales bacterium]